MDAGLDDLRRAIADRLHVRFVYEGQPRVVQPAALGSHVITDAITLRGYQTGGRSNSRPPPFWTMFTLDRIVDLEVAGDAFVDDPPGYADGDGRLVSVIAQL
ncbi:WYL domain-containing protein [Aeromicrobium endophyticum]|uniref:WYL domain-containing protein n=1 Tax=Aeromicrobium endophyticum TaxID=2292704 RepID=A0A371P9C4_9ACTN|nr:WYL domain-containing protein [Aeromicrobium endophyticum]REK72106.1 hypothetical protein DX116_00155 [Aeromicrobium endophyticum]